MSQNNPPNPEPSMDEILASIRARLSQEEEAEPQYPLDLTEAMLVSQPAAEPFVEPVAVEPAPAELRSASGLIGPVAAAAAAAALGRLAKTVASERAAPLERRGGVTIEDVVREEVRPLLRSWLDQHLPQLIERLVQTEIERLMGRPVPQDPKGS